MAAISEVLFAPGNKAGTTSAGNSPVESLRRPPPCRWVDLTPHSLGHAHDRRQQVILGEEQLDEVVFKRLAAMKATLPHDLFEARKNLFDHTGADIEGSLACQG